MGRKNIERSFQDFYLKFVRNRKFLFLFQKMTIDYAKANVEDRITLPQIGIILSLEI